MKKLTANRQIVIKAADKGSVVVLQDRVDYIAEGNNQLQDESIYCKEKVNLTDTHNSIVNDAIEKMRERGEIHHDTVNYLTNNKPRTSKLNLLPKIHKNKDPLPTRQTHNISQ